MAQVGQVNGLGLDEHLNDLRREAARQRQLHEIRRTPGAGERGLQRGPPGMRGFLLIWLGQAASRLGSSIVTFGLTIWAWQETGQATALALVGFFTFVPTLLVSPLAGVLVDRWNRKWTMLLSDAGSALAALVILILFNAEALEVWHLYLLGAWSGMVSAFQFPAFSAAITTLLPKEHYARAGGMRALLNALANIGGPALAGILLAFSSLATLLVFELVTFFVAMLTLLLVYIPSPAKDEVEEGPAHVWGKITYGFRYLAARRSLLGLTLTFTGVNLSTMLGVTVLSAMVLARSGNDEALLGGVRAALGLGGLTGGLFIGLWGGPKRKVYGVLLGALGGSVALMGLGVAQGFWGWAVAAFSAFFFFPMLDAFSSAIYQRKVPAAVQGRFFSAGRVISHTGTTLAYLVAGPLADEVFEPAMQPDGRLVDAFGWLVGVGPGAGMALMFVLAGLLSVGVSVAALFCKPIRDIETLLPEAQAATSTAPTASTPVA